MAKHPIISVPLISCILLAALISNSCNVFRSQSFAEEAQEMLKEGLYDDAIYEYQKHINYRLQDESRPADENPYFYYLLIGDIYLKQSKPEDAVLYYSLAKEKEVSAPFLSDRYRQLAYWYKQKGDYTKALEILETYRSIDETNFDYAIDEVHKQMLAAEDKVN
ncbi:MAG: hypothetical protein IT292_03595 [Deltaproteobacteria bacterium]|nr:hypothetical protein [Deltaproteobacteria bacterium]